MEDHITYREWLKQNPHKTFNPVIKNIEDLGDAVLPDLKSELDPNVPYEEIPESEIPF